MVNLIEPKTLVEAMDFFSDEDYAFEYFKAIRWPDGPVCVACGSKRSSFLSTRKMWKCLDCKKQYSLKKGTIFEDSPLGLGIWFKVVWLIANAKNGISSHEIERATGKDQKTAWFMLHRIRLAMQTGTFEKLSGTVEVDESFHGGKARNMHKDVKDRKITGTGGKDKTLMFGMIERGGSVVSFSLPDRKRHTLQTQIRKHVEPGARVFTDSLLSYTGLDTRYTHEVVDHAFEYVRGEIHTNSIENFWCLFKRCVKGTYVSIDPRHLDYYLAEECFRFNQRKDNDGGRFQSVMAQVTGKRVMWKELIARGLD